MLGSPILYLKAMRILMFQLSGYYKESPPEHKKSEVSVSVPETFMGPRLELLETLRVSGPRFRV